MIALDTSAIVAIACSEPEEEAFNRLISTKEALVGTPTLLETRMVLESKLPEFADQFMESFLDTRFIHPVAFSLRMYFEAMEAFRRFGKGRRGPAGLNFGDCMSYAVSKFYDAPLLYKGTDFSHTDIASAA
ncbi:MAG TPA: type II toxin-antitoxin system VapC family toxin [Beijerinckiaceae bacterium]|jgi:ribonuclease VapC